MNKILGLCLTVALFTIGSYSDAQKKSFVDVAGLDPQIKSGDNFFRYVNGRWYDTVKIASDQSGVGSYSFMNIPQKKLLQNILDSVSKAKNTMRSIERQVGDFYKSGMFIYDVRNIETVHVRPLRHQALRN